MSGNLIEFIEPFSTVNQYLSALVIAQSMHSQVKCDYDAIWQCINTQLKTNLSKNSVKNFIHRVFMYKDDPSQTAFKFVFDFSLIQNNMHQYGLELNVSTKTIEIPIDSCVFCGNCGPNWFKYQVPLFNKMPTLYMHDRIGKCRIDYKLCNNCHSMHYLSYAIQHKSTHKTFYKISHQEYFHFTTESIFEVRLLDNLLADLMFKHASFKSFTAAYNYTTALKSSNRYYLISARLTENFYCYHIQKYFLEFLNCNLNVPLETPTRTNYTHPIDMVLDDIMESLFDNFVSKWSKHKCSNPHCSYTLTFDGNWKISRIKCACNDGSIVSDFGEIVTGCKFSPQRKSYYCANSDHSKMNLIFKHGLTRDGNPRYLSLPPKLIATTRLKREEHVTKIYDSFVTQVGDELILCDTNKSKAKWLKIDQCKPIEKAIAFKELRNTYTATCNTDKTLAYSCDLKSRTRGIQIAATNCGFIIGFREMFGSESIIQVADMYMDIADNFKGTLPRYIVYDDACHLKKFVEKRIDKSERTTVFKDKIFVVDKLHITGHTDHNCRKSCHPDLFPDLKEINTVVVEQINFWVGRYKYMTKHMNYFRFNFFLFILFNQYNTLAAEGRFSLVEKLPETKQAIKRNIREIYSEEYDNFEIISDELAV